MTKKNEKKNKQLSPFAVGIIVIMFAIFCAQMIFPTNLGEVFDEKARGVESVNVTVTSGKDDVELRSYTTASMEDIKAFGNWAYDKTMRNRSLADSLSADAKTMTKYNFQIKLSNGSYNAIVIDEKGFVHVDSQLFKLSQEAESFISELEQLLQTWEE